MNLTFQIIRKDARRLAWPLALWLGLVVADIGLGVWLADGPTWAWDSFDQIALFHRLLLALQAAASVVLTARLVQEDPLIGTRAFWPTRPISRARLLGAKLLGLAVLLWLPPLLVMLPWWMTSGFGLGDMANVAFETVARQTVITLPAMTLATVTGGLGSFLVWGAALAVGAMAGNLRWLGPGWNFHPDDVQGMQGIQMKVVMVGVAVGWLAAGAYQFITGHLRRTILMLGICGVTVIGLETLGLWDVTEILWGNRADRMAAAAWLTVPPAMLGAAINVSGFTLSLGEARVVGRATDYVQLQLVIDHAQPQQGASIWGSETVWSWPDNSGSGYAPRRIVGPAPRGSSWVDARPLLTQLLAPKERFVLPLELFDRPILNNASNSSRMNPTAPAWLLGSRHAVTTKVKLVLWEVQNLAEAELKQDGRDLRDSRRLRVLGWGNGSYVPSVVPSNPPSILVTLAGRGPTPASSLLDGLLNDGEWNLPPVVALVNRTRTGFVQGRWSTPDEQRHLRIGGVGIVSERAYFGIYDNQSLEELPVNPIQPTGVVGRQRPKLDAAWFDGASIINPDFKPLGWIEREASVPDIKVQDDRRGTGSPQ